MIGFHKLSIITKRNCGVYVIKSTSNKHSAPANIIYDSFLYKLGTIPSTVDSWYNIPKSNHQTNKITRGLSFNYCYGLAGTN